MAIAGEIVRIVGKAVYEGAKTGKMIAEASGTSVVKGMAKGAAEAAKAIVK